MVRHRARRSRGNASTTRRCCGSQITGSAFCHQMVRSITGTMVDVGLHRLTPADVHAILHARDRNVAGQVAPPHGLVLWEVGYDGARWDAPLDRSRAAPRRRALGVLGQAPVLSGVLVAANWIVLSSTGQPYSIRVLYAGWQFLPVDALSDRSARAASGTCTSNLRRGTCWSGMRRRMEPFRAPSRPIVRSRWRWASRSPRRAIASTLAEPGSVEPGGGAAHRGGDDELAGDGERLRAALRPGA